MCEPWTDVNPEMYYDWKWHVHTQSGPGSTVYVVQYEMSKHNTHHHWNTTPTMMHGGGSIFDDSWGAS